MGSFGYRPPPVCLPRTRTKGRFRDRMDRPNGSHRQHSSPDPHVCRIENACNGRTAPEQTSQRLAGGCRMKRRVGCREMRTGRPMVQSALLAHANRRPPIKRLPLLLPRLCCALRPHLNSLRFSLQLLRHRSNTRPASGSMRSPDCANPFLSNTICETMSPTAVPAFRDRTKFCARHWRMISPTAKLARPRPRASRTTPL
jgi:hypothetical protein